MRRFPPAIQTLVNAFCRFPGVGPKTALRYVYGLLTWTPAELEMLARQIHELANKITVCPSCYTYTESGVCELCQDSRRDSSLLCVVEVARDIATMETTSAFLGRYFVLGGTINPMEGYTPDVLHIRELLKHIGAHPEINEIILAFSPDVHGETTMHYLSKHLKATGRKVTRLARGLPTGAALEFADELTLADALRGRRET